MARAKGRMHIVVDASVAQSSGDEKATYPTAIHCRDVLQAIRTAGHSLVWTPMIAQEWNGDEDEDKHRGQSDFARRWRADMFMRKRVVVIKDAENKTLRKKLIADASYNTTEAILKDCHLLEAALATDNTIIALDETMRNNCINKCGQVSEIAPIIWTNPNDEGITEWLLEGAKPHPQKRLCYTADS